MRKLASMLVLALVVLPAAVSTAQADADAEAAAIKASIEKLWQSVADKKYDPSDVHPAGQTQATSEGGLWTLMTPARQAAMLNESPARLDITPHNIEVRFLGANKDVAYVTYYLSGTIMLPGEAIRDYRTRASNVMEKVGGRWVTSAAHYSPLFGGSGVRFR